MRKFGVKTGVQVTAKQEWKHVKDTVLSASQYSKLRIKNAGAVVKDKLAVDAIEVRKAADTTIAKVHQIPSTRQVLAIDEVGKVHMPAGNTSSFENAIRNTLSKAEGVNVGKGKVVGEKKFLGDLMDSVEAVRYDEYWRKLGVGSNKTWEEFSRYNPNSSIDDYLKLVKEQSPWPSGYVPKKRTLESGERFEMALAQGQDPIYPGRFGTNSDTIQDVNYVREKLAVKNEWKPNIDKVVEYKVKDGTNISVLEGPVGPQIDLGTNNYLSGGANQFNILLDRNIDLMQYLEVISVRPIK